MGGQAWCECWEGPQPKASHHHTERQEGASSWSSTGRLSGRSIQLVGSSRLSSRKALVFLSGEGRGPWVGDSERAALESFRATPAARVVVDLTHSWKGGRGCTGEGHPPTKHSPGKKPSGTQAHRRGACLGCTALPGGLYWGEVIKLFYVYDEWCSSDSGLPAGSSPGSGDLVASAFLSTLAISAPYALQAPKVPCDLCVLGLPG